MCGFLEPLENLFHILFDILGQRTIANVMKLITLHVFSLIQSYYYSALICRGKTPLLGIK